MFFFQLIIFIYILINYSRNMTNKNIRPSIVLYAILFIFIFYFIISKIYRPRTSYSVPIFKQRPSGSTHRRQCLNEMPAFEAALQEQRKGIPRLKANKNTINSLMAAASSLNIGSPDSDGFETWANIPAHFNQIWKEIWMLVRVFKGNSDNEEIKYFLEFVNAAAECNVVTLGVGFENDPEYELSLIYPQCNFLAVDPESWQNRDLYNHLIPWATFIAAAVTGGGREGKPVLRKGTFFTKEGGVSELREHITIVDLLKEYAKNRSIEQSPNATTDPFLIDLLLMDVEGAEFDIIETLVGERKYLPTICQINIEMHFPPGKYNTTFDRVFKGLEDLMNVGGYILLHSDYFEPTNLNRLFFVQHTNRRCIEKFLC